MFVNEIAVSAFSFRGRCNYRPLSVYFIFLYFICMSAFFGSHFRSHDSHVTREHMVELGGHILLFFCKSKQFFNVHGHVHVY